MFSMFVSITADTSVAFVRESHLAQIVLSRARFSVYFTNILKVYKFQKDFVIMIIIIFLIVVVVIIMIINVSASLLENAESKKVTVSIKKDFKRLAK